MCETSTLNENFLEEPFILEKTDAKIWFLGADLPCVELASHLVIIRKILLPATFFLSARYQAVNTDAEPSVNI